MKDLLRLAKVLYKGEEGAVATEYLLLIAFMAFLIVIGMTIFGGNVNNTFSKLGVTLETGAGGATLPAAP